MSHTEAVTPDACLNSWLRDALGLADDNVPFPWQEELLGRFCNGMLESSLDIPTGLGKTAVIAIWLVARARGAVLPRRLVYVVDRRAVVDQATDVAMELRRWVDRTPDVKRALGLERRSLPISTLRGQYVDNKDWLDDPSSPAIIVGTVDMVGSRLLFEGYGVSRKMRPYHAGLLGVDSLLVLDEAHLVPPFEKLLEAIAAGLAMFGARGKELRMLIPAFNLLSLSATGRTPVSTPFGLHDADLVHPVVRRRLDAPKLLRVVSGPDDNTNLADALAEAAWRLTDSGQRALRIIVFSDKREMTTAAKAAVEKLAKGDGKAGRPAVEVDTELFVGGRRVFERERAAGWLKARGFIAGSTVERTRAVFVFATSAGEVGVDLDADHMVSDVVAWERMVQRLGRVNRRGEGQAQVIIVKEPPSNEALGALTKARHELSITDLRLIADAEQKDAVLQLVSRLPSSGEGGYDASPGALRALKLSAPSDPKVLSLLTTATTPAPLRPAVSRALVDSWSMTSLEKHTGRPEITPWLRGWTDDAPQTAVAWRRYLPVPLNGIGTRKRIEEFFDAAPPHASEMLETETFRVLRWLEARARKLLAPATATPVDGTNSADRAPLRKGDVVAILLTPAGDLKQAPLRLEDLDFSGDTDARDAKRRREGIERLLMGATLVLDARLGGLLGDGLLDHEIEDLPRTADDGSPWLTAATPMAGDDPAVPLVRFRVRVVNADRDGEPEWRESFRLAIESSDEGEPLRYLIVENSASEERRSTGRPQVVDEHHAWVERRARDLAVSLRLPSEYVDLLAIAARLHDEGKRAARWQRAFNAADDGCDYAKTRGPINFALLDGYRHEFGSLLSALKDPRVDALPHDLQDLALHLIAAHHGFARPVIGTSGCGEAPPSVLEQRAREVALRFARLQERWGPWGLAWWESLIRAADQQASREHDENKATVSEATV